MARRLPKDLHGLGGRWRPAPPGAFHDLETRDGRRLLKAVPAVQGARDLHGPWVRLAQVLAARPHVARAVLAVRVGRLSRARLRSEWASLQEVLRPGLRDRLALVVVGDGEPWTQPEDDELRGLAAALGGALAPSRPAPPAAVAPSPGFFEAFKVLLDHHLRHGGPVRIGEIVRRAGLSYPTVAEALKRLEGARELVRRSNRSVELAAFPRKTWAEILALAASLRRGSAFAAAGRPPRLAALLARIEKEAPPGVALGGVVAARRWDRRFDLHGLPRLDLSLHAPEGEPDLGWLRRVDPALRPAAPGEPGLVLAVHPLRRAEPGFEPRAGRPLPVADPVETLLDLHEMGLHAQGEELIARLDPRR